MFQLRIIKMIKPGEITAKQAAEMAGVLQATIYNWISQGRLNGMTRKHFGKVRINKEKFEAFVRQHTS